MKFQVFFVFFVFFFLIVLFVQDCVLGEWWDCYVDVVEVGFDVDRFEVVCQVWEVMFFFVFLVIFGGVVVVFWGDVECKFMCYLVCKSFLIVFFGIYWD